MIVNTEWGAFGNQGELDFILTKWDREVDKLSINPGKQIFEKMISGMYMGEVVRQVLIDLVHEGLMFVGQNTENLFQHGRYVLVWHISWCVSLFKFKGPSKSFWYWGLKLLLGIQASDASWCKAQCFVLHCWKGANLIMALFQNLCISGDFESLKSA